MNFAFRPMHFMWWTRVGRDGRMAGGFMYSQAEASRMSRSCCLMEEKPLMARLKL
ncbi:MAG: hypothetical protein ACLTW9_18500 [Enterocloster sp.]